MENKNIITILKTFLIWIIPLFVFSGFGSWFLFQKIKQEKIKLEEAKIENEEIIKQLQSFEIVKEDFEEVKKEKEILEKTVANSGNTLDLIKELEGAAQMTGVTLKTSVGERPQLKKIVSKAQNANDNKQGELWLQLEVEGKYFNILKFVHYLENSNKIISISTVSFNQIDDVSPELVFGSKPEKLGILRVNLLITNAF